MIVNELDFRRCYVVFKTNFKINKESVGSYGIRIKIFVLHFLGCATILVEPYGFKILKSLNM